VNVLGMDFLSENLLSLSMDYKHKSFQLTLWNEKPFVYWWETKKVPYEKWYHSVLYLYY
jgi:hypothetical protein